MVLAFGAVGQDLHDEGDGVVGGAQDVVLLLVDQVGHDHEGLGLDHGARDGEQAGEDRQTATFEQNIFAFGAIADGVVQKPQEGLDLKVLLVILHEVCRPCDVHEDLDAQGKDPTIRYLPAQFGRDVRAVPHHTQNVL